MKERYNLDIILVILSTFLCMIFVILPVFNETLIRTIFGLILILFMSGYSLISFLFPKKNDLDNIERIGFSFGLSIAITVLVGLVLNYTSFGIRLIPSLIFLSALTILLSVFAYIRRLKVPIGERFDIKIGKQFKAAKELLKVDSKTDKILAVLLICSMLFASITIIYTIATPKQDAKFTQFYILGPNGKADNYPTNLTYGETGNITVGIINHEYTDVSYKMVIKLNNIPIKEENITLSNGAKYEKPFTFSIYNDNKNQKLEFLLYKLPDDKYIYQSLHLWINGQ
ncbi:DUF1616 domain-containing protein [Methanobacterium sp.]|uniref:DUF1616 domain-containing protein n=1 Tax=Methanobacterium sp. TaxID=2164 RepID=UPI003C786660